MKSAIASPALCRARAFPFCRDCRGYGRVRISGFSVDGRAWRQTVECVCVRRAMGRRP